MRRRLDLSILGGLGLAVGVAAFFAWLGLRIWPDILLVVAIIGFGVWAVCAYVVRRDRVRLLVVKEKTLAAVLTGGVNVLQWIEAERPYPDPARTLFSQMRAADLAYQWYTLAKVAVEATDGPMGVAQFDSHTGVTAHRPKPQTIPENLSDYWDSVAWRLEWINDRMNRLASER